MGVLADHQIKAMLKDGDLVIEPHVLESPKGCISFGVSSYGYDVRVGYKFKIFTPTNCAIVDPKNFDPKSFVDVDLTPLPPVKCGYCEGNGFFKSYNEFTKFENLKCSHCHGSGSQQYVPNQPANHILIPPNSFALAETLEYIKVPRSIVCVLLDKSTYRRCGILTGGTVLEPEWEGKVTIEITNSTPLPAKIYAAEGICQLLFLKGDSICQTSYADKKGRYQNQSGIVLPFVQ